MALTQLRKVSDPTGFITVREWPGYIENRVLAANTAEVITVPVGAKSMRISTPQILWLNRNGVATVPAADVTDGTGQLTVQIGSDHIGLNGAETVGIICASIAALSIEFFG